MWIVRSRSSSSSFGTHPPTVCLGDNSRTTATHGVDRWGEVLLTSWVAPVLSPPPYLASCHFFGYQGTGTPTRRSSLRSRPTSSTWWRSSSTSSTRISSSWVWKGMIFDFHGYFVQTHCFAPWGNRGEGSWRERHVDCSICC